MPPAVIAQRPGHIERETNRVRRDRNQKSGDEPSRYNDAIDATHEMKRIHGRMGRFPGRRTQVAGALLVLGWTWLAAVAGVSARQEPAAPIGLVLRDGTVLVAFPESPEVQWQTLLAGGELREHRGRWDDIDRIVLTEMPQSQMAARIRQSVEQLGDADYQQREKAEAELRRMGKRYVRLLQPLAQNNDPEIRHRLERILKSFDTTAETGPGTLEMDWLKLADGSTHEGEWLDSAITVAWRQRRLELNRSELALVFNPSRWHGLDPAAGTAPAAEAVVERFNRPSGVFDPRDSPLARLDFETDRNGNKIVDKDVDVSRSFAFQGGLFEGESPGSRVGMAGHRFAYGGISRSRSIASQLADGTWYVGAIHVRFCVSDLPQVPATVRAFGFYLEVAKPRNHVLEAYGTAGHRIAVAETLDQNNAFVGVRSISEPIAWVRIRPNEDAGLAQLQKTFALDDVMFSTPVAAPELNAAVMWRAELRDGQRLHCRDVRISADDVTLISPHHLNDAPLVLNWSEVRSLTAPADKTRPSTRGNGIAVLADGSIVRVQAGDDGAALMDFDGAVIPWDSIVGFGSNHPPLRSVRSWSLLGAPPAPSMLWPSGTDFDAGRVAVVFGPWTVVGQRYAIADGRLTVDAEGALLVAANNTPVPLEQAPALPAEAAKLLKMPENPSAWREFALEEAPWFWFRMPPSLGSDTPMIRMRDGRQFVLGSDGGFGIAEWRDDALVVRRGEQAVSLPLSAIQFFRP
jgi:hypothetical protein